MSLDRRIAVGFVSAAALLGAFQIGLASAPSAAAVPAAPAQVALHTDFVWPAPGGVVPVDFVWPGTIAPTTPAPTVPAPPLAA
ncbi:hypothetical protein [Kitasatospora sp. McL0602]|uniref:hypothetical protein n=1 Tax=Kitasatospora sp. McL0602 TaxID=3439530 RepID=UPI003F898806